MKKKMLAGLLSFAMIISLSACGATTTEEPVATEEPAVETVAEPAVGDAMT